MSPVWFGRRAQTSHGGGNVCVGCGGVRGGDKVVIASEGLACSEVPETAGPFRGLRSQFSGAHRRCSQMDPVVAIYLHLVCIFFNWSFPL